MTIERGRTELLERLAAFTFDRPGARLTFAARLARENGWRRAYALRVVDEYRRFLFLACTSGHVVTPSEAVDRAWHLHLTYTRSYWQDLCRDTLGRELHHDPTAGGPSESARYHELYERTRESYAQAFGEGPPDDIWPTAERRFGEDLEARWVNVRRSWVLPRPRLRVRSAALGLAAPLLLPATGVLFNPFDLDGPRFLAFYALLFAVALVAAATLRHGRRTRAEAEPVEDLDPVEAAVLAHGEAGVGPAVLTQLLFDGTLELRGDRVVASAPPRLDAGRLEAAISESFDADDSIAVSEALEACAGEAADIRARLENRGLLESPDSFAPTRNAIVTLFVGLMAVGAFKIVVGIGRDGPAQLLLGLIVATAVALFLAARRPFRTALGHRTLDRLRDLHPRPAGGLDRGDLPARGAAMAVGLWGGTTLAGGAFDGVAAGLDVRSNGAGGFFGGCGAITAGWGDDGGGCSGGGCGGGGCGGCGGG